MDNEKLKLGDVFIQECFEPDGEMGGYAGFAVFQWVSEEVATRPDLEAFFASEWMVVVTAKGGRSPQFRESVEVTPEEMWLSGITPLPGQRLFRLFGHAEPPADVDVYEVD